MLEVVRNFVQLEDGILLFASERETFKMNHYLNMYGTVCTSKNVYISRLKVSQTIVSLYKSLLNLIFINIVNRDRAIFFFIFILFTIRIYNLLKSYWPRIPFRKHYRFNNPVNKCNWIRVLYGLVFYAVAFRRVVFRRVGNLIRIIIYNNILNHSFLVWAKCSSSSSSSSTLIVWNLSRFTRRANM